MSLFSSLMTRFFVLLILISSLMSQGLSALPIDTHSISDKRNLSLQPRGYQTGLISGILGTQIYQKIKEYREEMKRDKLLSQQIKDKESLETSEKQSLNSKRIPKENSQLNKAEKELVE